MHRQLTRTLIACLLICSVLIVPAYAESAVVTGSKVNLRAGPGTTYYIAATIERGSVVDVLDRSDPSWSYVNYNGIEGFMSSAYLSPTSSAASASSYASSSSSASASNSGITILPNEAAQQYPAGTKGYINTDHVRFRSGPGSGYSIVDEYSTGKTVEIVTAVGSWIAGYIDGNPGYVHKDYVTVGTYTPPAAVSSPSPSSPSGGITVVSLADILPDTYYSVPDSSVKAAGGITLVSPTPSPSPTPVSNAFYVSSPQSAVTPTVAPLSADGREAYIYGTYVRFRRGPGTNYTIIGTYNTGKEVIAYANAGSGWVFCRIDGQEGYVYGDYLYVVPDSVSPSSSASSAAPSAAQTQSSITVLNIPAATAQPAPTQQKKGYITGNNVRVRSAPSMTSKILGELFYGNEVVITGYADGWAQISVNGTPAYVYADYVKEGSYGYASSSSTQTSTAGYGSVSGQDIVNYAVQFLGSPYTWGGTSPETGFDCSGFVYYVFKHFGKTLNRVASDQASNGVHVDPANLQPGDILCFYSGSSYIGHAGIYIGSNKFIHASNSTTGVIISDLSGYYSTRGFEARRIV
ncbi:MAG: SH3 domain-containing C40 family peptidase [Eubacteriales bacterium]|nr:SH3 domain-containing C40 family peptidase [Eubacteriales bacterium]